MKDVFLLLGVTLATPLYAADITPYIVNGSDISATKYPSFVSLFYDRIDYDGAYSTSPYCGATLLSSQYVLTAAHCIYGDSDSQRFTSVVPQLQHESDFPDNVMDRVMVNEYYYPDSYNDDTLANDIAILKLATPITIVSDYTDRATVSDELTYRNVSEQFFAIGHGNTETGVDDSESLQETQLAYVANEDCNVYTGVDTSDNLCMTGATTVVYDNATCQGDSGGPLFWNTKQVGITSFGPAAGCGFTGIEPNSVFTEVSHHADWIDSVLNGNESPKVTITDEARNSALGISTTTSSSGGGGSLGLFSLLALVLFGKRRHA
ncbi:serine protease [Vibrio scophthalmi]|uniref:S1 family peptidase n=1 Tax=Vibrio scophthalmi TaxID=45658 RepID=UPI002FF24021